MKYYSTKNCEKVGIKSVLLILQEKNGGVVAATGGWRSGYRRRSAGISRFGACVKLGYIEELNLEILDGRTEKKWSTWKR